MADSASLQNAIHDARETAREQLSAAWQLQIERVQELLSEQLANGWRERLERVFEERFDDLARRVEAEYRETSGRENARARRDISGRLNQAVRRFRSFEGEEQWSRAFLDATTGFCARAALFAVHGQSLRLQVSRGFDREVKIDNTPLASAPAFAGAVETRDAVVALRTRGELSGPIAQLVGEDPAARFHLFPVSGRNRVSAVLYADADSGGALDPDALELLANLAGAVLEGQTSSPTSHLVSIATAGGPAASVSAWSSLTKQDQELHLRAQRAARVRAAEMRLHRAEAVKDGRLKRDIYAALQPEINAARDAFRRDFLSVSPTMVDYLHLEVLRTLANDDVELLGPEYPGPMV